MSTTSSAQTPSRQRNPHGVDYRREPVLPPLALKMAREELAKYPSSVADIVMATRLRYADIEAAVAGMLERGEITVWGTFKNDKGDPYMVYAPKEIR